MRKVLIKIVDVLLCLTVLVALAIGFYLWGLRGLAGALVLGALLGGTWAALSLMVEHLEKIRKCTEDQNKMLDALDYNVTAVCQQFMKTNEDQPRVAAR